MGTQAARTQFSWELLIFGVSMSLTRFLYIQLSRVFYVHGEDGMQLSTTWLILTSFYFLADLVGLVILSVIWKVRAGGIRQVREFFGHEFIEFTQVLLAWHFVLLVLEYPVSVRLESVGLGVLEVIAIAIFAAVLTPLAFRALRTTLKQYRGGGLTTSSIDPHTSR